VLFTRNPANGTNELYGEFLLNAQGEDVVAGIRTPMPISVLKDKMPTIYQELHDTVKMLERHMHDMQVRTAVLLLGASLVQLQHSACVQAVL
jgi:pyruvate,orthophosphate dikinase